MRRALTSLLPRASAAAASAATTARALGALLGGGGAPPAPPALALAGWAGGFDAGDDAGDADADAGEADGGGGGGAAAALGAAAGALRRRAAAALEALTGAVWLAVPKRKKSYSRKRQRQLNPRYAATDVQNFYPCPKCEKGLLKLRHHLCPCDQEGMNIVGVRKVRPRRMRRGREGRRARCGRR